MRRNLASSTSGRNSRSSCAPEWTKRKPVWEKRALPPDSPSGAFSNMTTAPAPASLAAIAASKAALPPPITMMSQVVFEDMEWLDGADEAGGEEAVAYTRPVQGQPATWAERTAASTAVAARVIGTTS